MLSILPQLIANSLIAAGTYALVALGFNLIYSTTKFFNLAHGAVAAVGGYAVFFILTTFAGINLILAAIFGIVVAAIVGWGLDRIVYRALRKRKASNLVLLVASLGAFTIIQAVIAMLFTSQFQMLSDATSRNVYQIFGAYITETQLIIIISAIVVMFLLMIFLKMTVFGKAIRAVSDDEEVAKISGINTEKVIGWVFIIGSAIAGLAGILVGFDTGIQPTMGLDLLLKERANIIRATEAMRTNHCTMRRSIAR
jgi:branched-subunit amino acid ABC-type transport system permease component